MIQLKSTLWAIPHHTRSQAFKALCSFTPKNFPKPQFTNLYKTLAKTSISCSYTMFMARDRIDWVTDRTYSTFYNYYMFI